MRGQVDAGAHQSGSDDLHVTVSALAPRVRQELLTLTGPQRIEDVAGDEKLLPELKGVP
jgi:hypothetical protein